MGEPQVGQVWSDGRVLASTVKVPSALRVYSLAGADSCAAPEAALVIEPGGRPTERHILVARAIGAILAVGAGYAAKRRISTSAPERTAESATA